MHYWYLADRKDLHQRITLIPREGLEDGFTFQSLLCNCKESNYYSSVIVYMFMDISRARN